MHPTRIVGTKCPICFEELETPVSVPCGHIFCDRCLTDFVTASFLSDCDTAVPWCPACRLPLAASSGRVKDPFAPTPLDPLRRLYIPVDEDLQGTFTALRKEIATLQAEVRISKQAVELLMTSYGQCRRELEDARAQTQEAQSEVERLRAELKQTKERRLSKDSRGFVRRLV